MKPLDANQHQDALHLAADKIKKHDISEALELLLQAFRDRPANIHFLNLAARCYYVLGEFEHAQRCWEEVLRIDPDNRSAGAGLSELQRPDFQFWLKRYQQALALVDKKDFHEAGIQLRRLLEEHDNFVALYKVLGLCYLAQGERREAHRMWRKGLSIDRTNTSLKQYLQLPEKRPAPVSSSPAEEISTPRQMLDRRTLMIAAAVLCLALVIETGAFLNARRDSAEVLPNVPSEVQNINDSNDEIVPAAVSSSVSVGEELSMAGSDYDISHEKEYFESGYHAYQQGDWKTAVSNLSVVVSIQSGSYLNREALYYLARSYYVQKDYYQADLLYRQYLQQFPDSNYYDDALFYLACTYYCTGQSDQARLTMERLQEFDPNSGYLSSKLYRSIME